MSNDNGKSPIGVFLLGFLCAAMLALLVRLDSPQILHADTGGGANGKYIAVTGNDSNSTGVLWLVNAKEEKIACYQWERNFLYLLGQREVKSDFEIQDFNNADKSKISSAQMKAQIAKLKDAAEKKKK